MSQSPGCCLSGSASCEGDRHADRARQPAGPPASPPARHSARPPGRPACVTVSSQADARLFEANRRSLDELLHAAHGVADGCTGAG